MSIQHAYRMLFNSGMSRCEAIDRLHAESGHISEVAHLLDFLGASERGVTV
jgi:acyl-[acyl carrier protein]--UDP-N-acetylglucosamine O-acyltransferase